MKSSPEWQGAQPTGPMIPLSITSRRSSSLTNAANVAPRFTWMESLLPLESCFLVSALIFGAVAALTFGVALTAAFLAGFFALFLALVVGM
jgi:hypothetical protein